MCFNKFVCGADELGFHREKKANECCGKEDVVFLNSASTFVPTVEYFQDVKLLLSLEQFKVQRDVVALLHVDEPGAHLEVGVVVRVAWTQNHPR